MNWRATHFPKRHCNGRAVRPFPRLNVLRSLISRESAYIQIDIGILGNCRHVNRMM